MFQFFIPILLNIFNLSSGSVDPVLLDPITFENGLYSVVSLGPERVQSNITFSCTVVNSGSFEWVWEYKGSQLPAGGGCYQVWTADATRTSILEISGLGHTDSGNYTCRVGQQGNTIQYNKTHELKLNGKHIDFLLLCRVTFVTTSVVVLVFIQ